ncbi:error-prone DNA polymerase [Roseomonas sp. SSH11]|uniref:Error-prone DNA polymerase n=1 Tax=Pararoseomonas baculiformis TaxID=2820812 RepID=A0ABS4ADH2_9PROT|nr:error-prone DNA polymerase [Pararoseomonas baculiformis]MBP0445053.1 error-prone DNA polymerase [Pararoseomonas baculiformis]
MASAPYAELQVTTNYSFLRGASHPQELFAAAAALGLPALGVADHNSVAGIVRCWDAARTTGVRLVAGCRVDLNCGASLLLYPKDRPGWSRLTRLLTLGKLRAGHRGFDVGWPDVASHAEGLLAVLVPGEADGEDELAPRLSRLRETFRGRAYAALTPRRRPGDAVRLHRVAELARAARVAPLATGDVLYHAPERRILQDVLSCVREGCTIDAAGLRLRGEADRQLRHPAEMARLLSRHPEAVARSLEVVERCTFDLGEICYQYPDETEVPGETAQDALERLTWAGAGMRYPEGVPGDVAAQLRHELSLIASLEYAPYFLTVNSIVRYARSKEILCQGRGSAANSAVCYVLGITSIDPTRSGLLFERFVSAERKEPPDIDVDFEAERREEVIQWVYDHYGRDRAALCCTVMRYRARGAVRDVGKVLGLPEDVTGALASQVWGWSEEGVQDEHAAELNLDPGDRRIRLTLELARQLIGFPRQLGTHPGGFVLTRDRLDDLVPIMPTAMANRAVVEWDKDDIDLLRMMKVDVLGLGMLGCLRRTFGLLAQHRGLHLTMADIPPEDPATYAMIRRADTLGTFQIESRAQMAMLPRMKPRTFYDLVIEVAVVRPGPIQGDMVHPYLRRREEKEPVTYPTPELERVLSKTLGVPLFQEQAMQVAIVCAGFTPGEADNLRRAMATFKFTGGVSAFKEKLVSGMVARGYDQAFAERTFSQIEGFGSYGFPESHAASFALIAYASSWLKCHHPDAFCAGLLNSQPMGFYAPAQVVRDAREHGVEVRPVCVNRSSWDCTLEPTVGRHLAVRLGLRMARGLDVAHGEALVARRGGTPYRSPEEIQRRARIPVAALRHLAEADAFLGLGLGRREALWAIRGLADGELPLFAAIDQGGLPAPEATEPEVLLADMAEGRKVVEDYRKVGLSLRQHPVAFLREELSRAGMVACGSLASLRSGRRVTVAGLVLVRQKPGSAKGVMFITIEDETGVGNLIVWPKLFEAQRRLVLSAGMVACRGRVQSEDGVTHLIAEQLTDLTPLLNSVGRRGEAFPLPHGRGDEAHHGGGPDHREQEGLAGRKARDIYIPDLRLGSGIKVPTRDFR